ncbi:hypothetical protein F5887DRAFT_1068518 [Amanita rubescens]|nr:hypothetical protein F5887DRAFT_1068518 [Amanita rubescens]
MGSTSAAESLDVRAYRMHLFLSKSSHLNSSYVNDDGQVLYKVKTPFQFKFGLVSTIKSALPDYIPAPGSSKINGPPPYKSTSDNDVKGDVEFDATPDDDVDADDVGLEDAELRERFAHLAEIKFNKITSSVMRYRGEEFKTSEFFTKKELGWFGRHRAFTGPDGLEYKWILGFRVPELVRQDVARTPVARFHRRRLGVFGKARQASLEIFPEGMHMVDLILVTFVYAQKIRNDAERASRRQIYTSY